MIYARLETAFQAFFLQREHGIFCFVAYDVTGAQAGVS